MTEQNTDTRKVFDTIKEALGVNAEDTAFDSELNIHLNSAFALLVQIGAFDDPVSISGDIMWGEVYSIANPHDYDATDLIELFVFLHVKLLFDPPVGSTLTNLQNIRDEIKWRIRELFAPYREVPTTSYLGGLTDDY